VEEPCFTVLLVEDYEPFRRFVVTKLQAQPQLRILSEVCDGAEAVQKAEELQPDLILLDVGLPTLNGIEAARRIREVSPNTKILFVSENRSTDIAEEALRAGGLGYVVKSDAEKDLLPGIDAALHGKRFISASLAGHFLVTTTLSATQTIHLRHSLTHANQPLVCRLLHSLSARIGICGKWHTNVDCCSAAPLRFNANRPIYQSNTLAHTGET